MALVLGLLAGGTAGIAAWQLVPEAKYQVRGMVHLAAVPETILGKPSHDTETNFNYLQKTQITLIKSQVIVDAVLANPVASSLRLVRMQASPKEWLHGMLEADFRQGPEVLSISMKGDEVEDLVVLVNAVIQAYLNEFLNLEERRRQARLQKLLELETSHEAALHQKRGKLSQLAPRMGGGHPGLIGGLHEGILKQINNANEEMQTVQADLSKTGLAVQRLEQQLAIARTSKASPDPSLVDEELNKDPQVLSYVEEINRLEILIAKTRRAATPKAAAEALAKNRALENLEDNKRALEERRKEIKQKVVARLNAKRVAEIESELERKSEDLSYLKDRNKKLTATLIDLAKQAKDKGEEAFQLGLLVREVEEEDKILTAIIGEIRALRLDMVAPPRAKPLDRAVVIPNTARKRLLLTVGGAGGLFVLSVLGVGVWEFSKRKIACVDEVIFGFGIGVVGTLPVIHRRLPKWAKIRQPVGFSGHIDSFRTILLRGETVARIRALLVTSAEPSEGKTSLATHLAASLARSGRKTLLLDADMRQPTAHRLFNLSRAPGLSGVLLESVALEEAVRMTGVPNLWAMTAGECLLPAIQRLNAEVLTKLFACLKQRFDIIVVDSCPVLPVADSLHVAQCTDGVVFSILRNKSRLPKVSAALQRIRMLGVPVLAAVVNGTDEDVYSSSYYAPIVAPEP